MKRFAKFSLITCLAVIGLTFAAALLTMLFSSLFPADATITFFDNGVAMQDVPNLGLAAWFGTLIVLWLGYFIAAMAVAFALVVSGGAMLIAAASLAFAALMLISPLLVVGAVVWWLVRRKPASAVPPAPPADAPAASAGA